MDCRKDHSSVSHVMAIINVKNIIIGFFGLILLGFIANVTQLQEVQRESSGTEQRAEILPGTWKQVYTESRNCGTGGETMFRGFMKLTDHVTTVDTRAISDFSALRVDDVMAEISGNRGIDPHKRRRGEEIDCPIFVFKDSVDTGMEPCRAYIFLSALIEETKKRFGAYPIMVITFGDSIANKDQILDEIVLTGMPKSSVFFIENYTKDNHEVIKERHVTLLKILEACILRADDNIAFRWTKEKEIPWWKKWWKIANQN